MQNIVKRTTLIVRDMDTSVEWYQKVMGMTVWMDTDFVLSGDGLAAGKEGDKTHLVIMQCEDPVIGMIGLLQWVDPPLPAAAQLGTRIHCPPREWSTKGHDGRTKHFIGISLFDPDGYFYECNQLLRIED